MQFTLTPEQEAVFNIWDRQHRRKCPEIEQNNSSLAYERLEWIIRGTPDDLFIRVRCPCGEEKIL